MYTTKQGNIESCENTTTHHRQFAARTVGCIITHNHHCLDKKKTYLGNGLAQIKEIFNGSFIGSLARCFPAVTTTIVSGGAALFLFLGQRTAIFLNHGGSNGRFVGGHGLKTRLDSTRPDLFSLRMSGEGLGGSVCCIPLE
jgi:hypothetical protein